MSRLFIPRSVMLISWASVLFMSAGEATRASTYYCFTGSFTDGSEVQRFYFTQLDPLTSAEPMSFKTWHYNGGTNWAGQTIAGGNFDPTLGLYNDVGTLIAYNDDSTVTPPYPNDSHIPRTLIPDPLNAGNYYLELRSYWGDLHGRGPDWAVDIEGPDNGSAPDEWGMYLTGVSAAAGSTLKSFYLGSDDPNHAADFYLGPGQSINFTEDIGIGFKGNASVGMTNATMQCDNLYVGYDSNGFGSIAADKKDAHLTVNGNLYVGFAANSGAALGNWLMVTRGASLDSPSPSEKIIGNASGSVGVVYVDQLSLDETTRATWISAGLITVGNEGKGSLTIRGGALVQSPGGSIAKQAGSANSIVEVYDSAGPESTPAEWDLTGNLYVGGGSRGPGDTGTLSVSTGGWVNITSPHTLKVWNTGTVNLSGGQISTGSFINSGGTFTHTDGILEINAGAFDPDTTNYNIDGADTYDYPSIYLKNGAIFNLPGLLRVGNVHAGSIEVQSDSHLTSATAQIGYDAADGRGSVYVTGPNAVWTINGTATTNVMSIGAYGYGYLYIGNQGKVELTAEHISSRAMIGDATYSLGVLVVDGPGSLFKSDEDITVGYYGYGILSIANGGKAEANPFVSSYMPAPVGTAGNSHGVVVVDGVAIDGTRSQWIKRGPLEVGYYGLGEVSITNGALISSLGGFIAGFTGSAGSKVTLEGTGPAPDYFSAEWFALGGIYVGGYYYDSGDLGTLTVKQGGWVHIEPSAYDYTLKIWSPGTVELLGGRITTGSLINSGGTFTHTDGILEIYGGTFNTGTVDYAIDGAATTDYPYVYLYSGATFSLTGRLDVGREHFGYMYIEDNSHVTSSLASVGSYTGSNGYVLVYGSNATWTVNGTTGDGSVMWIGGDDYGFLYIGNQGKVELTGAYSYAIVGNTTTGHGEVWVEGSGSRFESRNDMHVGNWGYGSLHILDGGAVVTNIIDPGYYPTGLGIATGSTGEAFIDGVASDGSRSQWIMYGNILAGWQGRGTVSITNGALLSSRGGIIAGVSGSSGSSITLEGTGPGPEYLPAEWDASDGIYVGGNYIQPGASGTLTVKNGGWVHIDPVAYDPTLKIWNTGSVELLGGRITVGSFINDGGTITHTDGLLEINGGTFDPGVTNYVLDGAAADDLPTVMLLNGATANIPGDITVGNVYHGSMTISGGSQASCSNNAYVGKEVTSTLGSMLDISGDNSLLSVNGDYLIVGWNGLGAMYISNGASVACQDAIVGLESTAAGSGVAIYGAGTTVPQAIWSVAGQLTVGDPAGGGDPESVGVYIGIDGVLSVGSELSVHASGLVTLEDGTILSDHIVLYGGKLSGGGHIDDPLYSQNGTVDVPVQGSLLYLHDSIIFFGNSILQKTGPGTLLLQGGQYWSGNSAFVASDGITQYACLAPSSMETSSALLAISDGGIVQVVSAYDPFTDQTDPEKHVAVFNDGLFEIYDDGTPIAVASIEGTGQTYVHYNAQLETGSIIQNSLTIGAGAKVVIRPLSSGAPASQPVPEPSLVLLAGLALLCWSLGRCQFATKQTVIE
jgi:T5SS/PEP-CTERM-associated repeat protein